MAGRGPRIDLEPQGIRLKGMGLKGRPDIPTPIRFLDAPGEGLGCLDEHGVLHAPFQGGEEGPCGVQRFGPAQGGGGGFRRGLGVHLAAGLIQVVQPEFLQGRLQLARIAG